MSLSAPIPSRDGKKLFVVGATTRGQLMRYDVKSGQFAPFLGGMSAEFIEFSRDGQWVAYVTYPEGTLWRSKADGSERLQLTYPPNEAVLPRWSPDGKSIVFYEDSPGKPMRTYEVSPEGGTPRALMPDDPNVQADPNWSPDGGKIVFSGFAAAAASAIRILDLNSHQVSTLPGSQGFFSPRWSPDGRSIVAMTSDSKTLLLFDFQTQKWTEIARGTLGWPAWSKDGQYVYVLNFSNNSGNLLLKLRLSDHTTERMELPKSFVGTGYWGPALGLGPDDSPLLLRDAGTYDVYALDWEEP
jgi:Tol biopolymer transport system component